MADQEFANVSSLVQIPQCSSPQFLEITCKSSGKVRRFSVGTEASFALQLINQKLAPGVPLASYIEAVKQGEEPIIFGPSSRLVSYGDGWKLQTATNGGRGKQSNLEVAHQEFPNVIEQATDNVEFAGEVQFQPEVPQQEVETPIVSEAVSNIESISEKIDMTDVFTTDTVFNSRDELLKWTRELGKSVGTVIVIKKSDLGSVAGRTPRIVFGCERFGKYKAKKGSKQQLPTEQTKSKKCDCPFVLKGIKMPKEDQWVVKVDCGLHNHPLGLRPEGHSYAGKLTAEEEAIVREMSLSGLKPKEVLNVLKERDTHNATTRTTIYNIRQKLKLTRKSRKSQCNS